MEEYQKRILNSLGVDNVTPRPQQQRPETQQQRPETQQQQYQPFSQEHAESMLGRPLSSPAPTFTPYQAQQAEEKQNIFQRIGNFFNRGKEKQKQTVVDLNDVNYPQSNERMSVWKEATQATKRTVFNTLAEVQGIKSLTAAVFGRDAGVVREYHDNAQLLREKAGEYERTIDKIEEIKGASDFGRWALASGIEMLPIVGAIMVGGATGAKMTSSSPTINKLFSRLFANRPDLVGKAAAYTGSYIGSFSVGYGAYASSIFETGLQHDADIDIAKRAALIYGVPASAVSIIFPAYVSAGFTSAFGRAFVQSKMKAVLSTIVLGMSAEGLAEGVAEYSTIMGEQAAIPGYEVSPEEVKSRIINAMAGGALMGGMFGGSTVFQKGPTITSQALNKQIEIQLQASEEVLKSRRSPIIESYLIEQYEAATNLNDSQKEFLNYLKAQQRKPVAKEIINSFEATDRQMVDIWKADDSTITERMRELVDKPNRTAMEENELGLMLVNKPQVTSDFIKTFKEDIVAPSQEGAELRILRQHEPKKAHSVQDVVAEYGDIGYTALKALQEKGFVKLSDSGDMFSTALDPVGYGEQSAYKDAIDEVYTGEKSLYIDPSLRTDAKKLLGEDAFNKIFTEDTKAESLEDFSDSVGLTPIDILQELGNRTLDRTELVAFPLKQSPYELKKYKMDKKPVEPGFVSARIEIKPRKQVYKESAPYLLTLEKHNIDWNKLSREQKDSVKMWDKMRDRTEADKAMKRNFFNEAEDARESSRLKDGTQEERLSPKIPTEDLPPDILLNENIKKDQDSTDPDTDPPITDKKQIISPERDFETLLNLKVDRNDAQRVLLEIAKDLGLDSALMKKLPPNVGGYMIMHKKFPQMVGKQMWDLAVYAHEIGHVFDLSLSKTTEQHHTEQHRIKNRITKVPLETLIENAEKLKVNIKELLEKPEIAFKYELVKAKDYVRNWSNTQIKDPRNDASELFASWFVLYIHDYNTAKLLAPNFTDAMEVAHLDKLNMVRDRYRFPVERTGIAVDTLIKDEKNKVSKWLDLQIKSLDNARAEDIKYLKAEYGWWKKGKNFLVDIARTPYWYSINNEKFRQIYNIFSETAVYGAEGKSAEMFLDSGLLELDMEAEPIKNLIVKKLYEGTDRNSYYTDAELKENYSFTQKEIDHYNKLKDVVEQCTELQIETRKINMGYYDMDMAQREVIDKKARDMVKSLEGYFPKTRSGKWIVYGELQDKIAGERGKIEMAYNRFQHKSQPLFSSDAIPNAQQYAADLKQRGYTNIVIKPVETISKLEIQKIARGKNIPYWEVLRIIEAMGLDKNDPAIREALDKIEKEKAEQWGGRILQRKDVPGLQYNFTEAAAAMNDFMQDSVRLHARAKAKYEIGKVIASLTAENVSPETATRMDSWSRNVFNNTDHKGFLFVRKLIYTWFLSWKTSYIVQNLCQPLMTTMGEIGNYLDPVQTPIVWKKGYELSMNFARHRGTKGEGNALKDLVSPKNREVDAKFFELMDRGVNEGHISGHFTQKMMQVKQYSKSNNVDNFLGLYSIISETINRTHAMATGYEIAVNHLNMKDSQQIYDFMKQISFNTQFAYGNHNVPFILNDTARTKGLLKTLIVFKTFSLNYMNFFWYRILRGEHFTEQNLRDNYNFTDAEIADWKAKKGPLKAEKLYGIGNMIGLAGIRGLPFFALINLLPRWLFGQKDLLTMLRELVGGDDEPFYDYLMGGAFSWLNMSTSNLLGVGELISPNYDPMGQVFGAGYSMITDANRGYQSFSEGDLKGAAERLSPIMLRNILVANRWREEGINFGRGVHYEPDGWEIRQKMFGFTPYKVAEQYEARNIENHYKDGKSELRRKYMNAVKNNNISKAENIVRKEIVEHNKQANDAIYVWFYYAKFKIEQEAYDKIYKSATITTDDITRWYNDALE